jgi:hypothetical protein
MAGTLHPLEDVNVLKQRGARVLPGDPRGMRADRVGWCGWCSVEQSAQLVGRNISAEAHRAAQASAPSQRFDSSSECLRTTQRCTSAPHARAHSHLRMHAVEMARCAPPRASLDRQRSSWAALESVFRVSQPANMAFGSSAPPEPLRNSIVVSQDFGDIASAEHIAGSAHCAQTRLSSAPQSSDVQWA